MNDSKETVKNGEAEGMTTEERKELRALLAEEVEDWRERRPDFVLPWDRALDEDSGQFYVTKAELAVFHLKTAYFPALFVAYSAYEVFIGIVEPMYDTERVGELIVKARSICPPAKYGEFSFPLEPLETPRRNDRQWFMWFAREFFDIPFRQSSAFFDKRSYNLAPITTFADEKEASQRGDNEITDDIPF